MYFKSINLTNKLTLSRHRQNAGSHRRHVNMIMQLSWERLTWLPVDVFLAAVQVCLRSLLGLQATKRWGSGLHGKNWGLPGNPLPLPFGTLPCQLAGTYRFRKYLLLPFFLQKLTSICRQNWSCEEIPSSQNSDKAASFSPEVLETLLRAYESHLQ